MRWGLVLVVVLSGCSSYQSTAFQNFEGHASKGPQAPGIPVTLKVNRTAFIVSDTLYRMPDGTRTVVRKIADTPITLPTYEVFTVDVKRPAVGKAKIDMTLSEQYPVTINSEVDDQTLKTIIDGLATLKQNGVIPGFADQMPGDRGDINPKADVGPPGAVMLASREFFLVYNSRTGLFEVAPMPDFAV